MGVPAGQLYIDIVANIASLQQDMQKVKRSVGDMGANVSRVTRTANDNLRSIGTGAGQGLKDFSRDVARLKANMDPAWASLQRYRDQVGLLRRALAEGAITHKQFVAEMRTAVTSYQSAGQGVAQATNAQRAGMQQLSFQLGDVATMYSMGATPMRIFASQASQVSQAVGLMTNGQKGLIAFMGGPWGQVIIGAVTILGSLMAAHKGAAAAAEEQKDAADDLRDAMESLHEATVRESMSTWASIQTDIDKANSMRTRAQEARELAVAELQVAKANAEAARSAQGYSLGDAVNTSAASSGAAIAAATFDAQVSAIEGAISELESRIGARTEIITLKRGEQIRMEVAAQFDGAAAATLKYEKSLDGLNRSLRMGKINQDEYREGLVEITTVRERETEAARNSERTSRRRRAALTEEEKAIKRQTESTTRFIEALEEEIAKVGLDAKALRQLEVSRELAAAQTDQEKNRIRALNEERERALALEEARQAQAANDNYRRDEIHAAERQLQLIGLTGVARQKMALAIAEQAEIEAVLVQIQKAEREGNTELIAQLEERIRLIREKYDIEYRGADMAKRFEDEADAARILNDELHRMVGLFGNLGGLGEVIGTLFGITTGNISAIGGRFGELLNLQVGIEKDAEGRVIAKTLGDELREVFKLGGEFGKTMTQVLQDAGTGMLAAQAIFGRQNMAGQLGSAVGGAVAGAFSKDIAKLLGGGALGSIGGALVPIVGGVAGGLLGSIFNFSKTSAATLTGSGDPRLHGSGEKNYGTANSLAGQVLGSLQQIADALGGTVGSFYTTIGVRGGDYRVNTTSTSLKTKNGARDFNQDADAAIAYAIADAIRDGAIKGISAGAQRIIQGGGDVQTQLQKALAFEGVFKEFKDTIDPVGEALRALDAEFEYLKGVFKEAAATADEYAQLEELMARKRQDIIDEHERQAAQEASERVALEVEYMRLLGRESEALAMAREQELATTEKALRPLQEMIYQLQDANEIIAQFSPLADDLRAFKQELLGGVGRNSFAYLQRQFRETAELARNGDAAALGGLRGTANDFLEAARANAASELEYRRAVSQVMGAVDDGIFAADSQIEYAQQQIEAIEASRAATEDLKKTIEPYLKEAVETGRKIENLLSRFEGDGFPIKAYLDEPLAVDLVA